MPYSGLHPQGFTVSSFPAATFNELRGNKPAPLARGVWARSFHHWRRAVPFLCHCRDSRHPHLRAAACLAGGRTFLSGTGCATVGRALPLPYNSFAARVYIYEGGSPPDPGRFARQHAIGSGLWRSVSDGRDNASLFAVEKLVDGSSVSTAASRSGLRWWLHATHLPLTTTSPAKC